MSRHNNEELTRWVELYSKSLLDRALYLVENKDDAMDLVQEVFIAAAASHHSFEERSSPLTWLHQILKNKVSDFYRAKYRKPSMISLTGDFDSSGNWADDTVLREWRLDVADSESEHALIEALDHCLEYLPARCQVTMKYYYLEERKASEVCQVLGISTTNLWKILQRGRLQLRKCIELNLA